ncbi:MAG: XisI protein [Janthinobacterium lividum]
MDVLGNLEAYRTAIERVLTEYAHFLTTDAEIVCETVFDRVRDRYLLVEIGWENGYRIYGPLLHIDICEGKLWIQHHGTEDGVAGELTAGGVSKDHIVLAFRPISLRAPSGYAVA